MQNYNLKFSDRTFGLIEMIIQCMKFQGIFNTFKICFYYLECRYFSKFTNSKVFKFLNYKIYFVDINQLPNMLFELYGLNVYYFKSDSHNPIIVDIGANIGDSVLYFKWLYPHSEIYAFEPLDSAYKLLEKNLNLNHIKKVHIYNVGLGGKNRTVKLYTDVKGTSVSSTIDRNFSKFKYQANQTHQTIKIQKISSYKEITNLHRIDLIKIDIEGSEGELFDDLVKVLPITKRVIMEFHLLSNSNNNSFDRIISTLKKFGFQPSVFGIYRNFANESNPFVFLITARKV